MTSSLITPASAGLPAHYTEYRPGQADSVLDLACSETRFTLLSAPPGAGKSALYMSVARILQERALILVGTKELQNQLIADFNSIGLFDMRGQSNYPCVAVSEGGELSRYGNTGDTCDTAPCHVGVQCGLKKGGCTYYDDRTRAASAKLVVSNYAYWLAMGRHADPNVLGEFDCLILDEAHAAPDWLVGFCAVALRRRDTMDLLGIELPPLDEGVPVWSLWARDAHKQCQEAYKSLKKDRTTLKARARVRKLIKIARLGHSLSELARAHDWKNTDATAGKTVEMPGTQTDWVAESTTGGALFSPVWAHAYAEDCLFRDIPRVILVSATLPPSISSRLGIADDSLTRIDIKRGFPPKNRPLFYIPTARVDRNMIQGDTRVWLNRIDQIIKTRLDRKGVIHTRSYARARLIVKNSRFAEHMITHRSALESRKAIAAFKRAKAPCILVSPSAEEGLDLPGDQCEYQIIAKIPFQDGRGPLARARKKSDKNYLNDSAALAVTQMVGRGVRSSDDRCETFLIDDHWKWFKHKGYFPPWFKLAWKQLHRVPDPIKLDRLGNCVQEEERV